MFSQSSSQSTTSKGTPTTGRRKSARPVAASLPVSAAPSTDTWPTLIKRWQTEDLTLEQAIGQLLLWGQYLHEETVRLQRLQAALERQVVALQAQEEAK